MKRAFLVAGFVFSICILVTLPSNAERMPDSPEDASIVVRGLVKKVFKRETSEQNQYIVQIRIEKVERAKDLKKEDSILVYCFQRKKTAPPIPAESGHKAIPKEGQQIRAFAMKQKGKIEGIYDDWFTVIKSKKSDSSK